jgi:hypothetical protein
MNIKPLTVIIILAITVGIATPVALSAFFTRQEIIQNGKDRALVYASDVLARSEAVTDQLIMASRALRQPDSQTHVQRLVSRS